MSERTENSGAVWVRFGLVWLALLGLLGVTVASAYIRLDGFNTVANLGIAAVKAALVALFFMHLRQSSALIRLAAAAGLFWLAFMVALTFSDYLSRA